MLLHFHCDNSIKLPSVGKSSISLILLWIFNFFINIWNSLFLLGEKSYGTFPGFVLVQLHFKLILKSTCITSNICRWLGVLCLCLLDVWKIKFWPFNLWNQHFQYFMSCPYNCCHLITNLLVFHVHT